MRKEEWITKYQYYFSEKITASLNGNPIKERYYQDKIDKLNSKWKTEWNNDEKEI